MVHSVELLEFLQLARLGCVLQRGRRWERDELLSDSLRRSAGAERASRSARLICGMTLYSAPDCCSDLLMPASMVVKDPYFGLVRSTPLGEGREAIFVASKRLCLRCHFRSESGEMTDHS